jgi:tetratricopeptide (TPR) repeat protein
MEMEALQSATALANSGRYADAKALLLSEHARVDDWPADLYGFSVLRLLARCHRAEHDFGAAREAITRAVAIARSIRSPQAEAIALEGAALIEQEDDHIHLAGSYFSASAVLEGRLGNVAGRAAALANYANMLLNRDIEGAEPILREGLRDVEPGNQYYLSIVDNLAGELHRQGRYSEAVDYSRTAVSGFLADGLRYDAYLALRTLARVLAGADRMDESADAFVQAHDLIRDLRRAEVDDQHYDRYHDRVEQIQARSKGAIRNSPVLGNPEFRKIAQLDAKIDPLDLLVGLYAQAANKAQQEGMELLEAGQYAPAIGSLMQARESWQEIQALHMLVTVDYHLALAFTEIGDTARAFPLLFRSRALAHELGDAWREGMSLSLLGRIGEGVGGRDQLDYLLEARALEPCTRRQLGFPEDVPTDGGVLVLQPQIVIL